MTLLVRNQNATAAWHSLDQTQLNTQNAINAFGIWKPDYQSQKREGQFEHQPGDGFSYHAIPWGLHWLVAVRDYCGNQAVDAWGLVGRMSERPSYLSVSRATQWDSQVRLAGDLLLSDQDILTGATPLISRNIRWRRERPPIWRDQGFSQHLQAPFGETWFHQLRNLFPNAEVRRGVTEIDLAQLSSTNPVFLSGDALTIHGHYTGPGPLVIVARASLETSAKARIQYGLVLAKQGLLVKHELHARHIHLAAAQIKMTAPLDFEGSMVVWTSEDSSHAQLQLLGKGIVKGYFAALGAFETNGDSKAALLQKSDKLTSEGFLYSSRLMDVAGLHRGSLQTRRLIHQDQQRTVSDWVTNFQWETSPWTSLPWNFDIGSPHFLFIHPMENSP